MYRVMKYINENIKQKLSLEKTAALFGYSKWHFCENFKLFTGVPFVEYVRHRRMQLASIDVISGRKFVDIALDYGYETPGGFNKAFLSEFGCLPKEFKTKEKLYRNLYEERRGRMFHLSDRCAMLRENAVEKKANSAVLACQRDYHYFKGVAQAPPEKQGCNGYLTACGIASVIENFVTIIDEGELIAGHNYGADVLFGGKEWEAQQLEGSLFSRAEIENYFSYKASAGDRFESVPYPYTTNETQRLLSDEMAAMGDVITDSHSVIDYEKVLKLGFEGILAELCGKDGEFFENLRIVCKAACGLGERYAKKAKELLRDGAGDYKKDDLEAVISTCEQVPKKPARSFLQAVQSLWFAHIINTWEDGINANSLGRLDQILYPYYKADIENGLLTKKEAFDILCCLWIKLYRDYDVQQSCVGGCDKDGNCAVNELSYLMLDVTEALNFVRCLSVRFSQNTQKEFIKRALEVVGHVQKGIPFFFNDDVIIPALTGSGIAPKDAADYTQIGCVETVIPGKSNPHAVTARCNLLKAVEYALNDGGSMINTDVCPGVKTGELGEFKSYTDFKNAVFGQIRHIVTNACDMTINCIPAAAINAPKPYKSLLTEGCAESGRDFNDRGAKYDYYQVMLMGLPNLADSMAVVKELVYKQKKYSLEQVAGHLQNNFPDELVRLEFVNRVAKFGNDIDDVDNIAVEIMGYTCDLLGEISKATGVSFHAQPFTFLWMVDHGLCTAATPDGRREKEILAYSVSPMQGRDFNGFTALLNSLSKLPAHKAPGTTSAIVEVDPQLFTDKNIPHFADILLAAAGKGLCNAQFNLVDADTLRDAQKNPEKYSNLAVRVSGFSQKFDLLDKTMQDHIIERTKHKYI